MKQVERLSAVLAKKTASATATGLPVGALNLSVSVEAL